MASRISERDRSRPPWFLMASMVLTWFIGMYGLTGAASTVAYLRQGNVPDAITAQSPAPDLKGLVSVARQRALVLERQKTLPIALAEALLGFVLVVGSVMAAVGRPGGRSLLTQALLANVALVVVGYVLTRGVRDMYIAEVARAGPEMMVRQQEHPAIGPLLWWTERVKVALFEVAPLLLALMALWSKRSQAYFQASASASKPRIEDNDEDS